MTYKHTSTELDSICWHACKFVGVFIVMPVSDCGKASEGLDCRSYGYDFVQSHFNLSTKAPNMHVGAAGI